MNDFPSGPNPGYIGDNPPSLPNTKSLNEILCSVWDNAWDSANGDSTRKAPEVLEEARQAINKRLLEAKKNEVNKLRATYTRNGGQINVADYVRYRITELKQELEAAHEKNI